MRRPLGSVAVVTPWNWPYTMPAEVVAPALAAGNTVVWTPAPSTAVCSGLLAECVAEADLPPGVFNFVLGPGPVVGDELVANPGTAAVGFIGSTATGRQIASRAAGKTLLLEMGGNGPLVVMDGADVEAAAEARDRRPASCARASRARRASGCWWTTACATSSSRSWPRKVDGREARRPVREDDDGAAEQRAGGGEDGRARRRRGRRAAHAWSRAARATAASRPSCTGRRRSSTASRLTPRRRARRRSARSPRRPDRARWSEAIELTNASPYGLLAAIFTGDVMDGLRFADQVRTGLVNINETTNYWENHLPFGGRAGTDSGTGRVGGRYALERLTELQTIVIG